MKTTYYSSRPLSITLIVISIISTLGISLGAIGLAYTLPFDHLVSVSLLMGGVFLWTLSALIALERYKQVLAKQTPAKPNSSKPQRDLALSLQLGLNEAFLLSKIDKLKIGIQSKTLDISNFSQEEITGTIIHTDVYLIDSKNCKKQCRKIKDEIKRLTKAGIDLALRYHGQGKNEQKKISVDLLQIKH